MRGRIGESEAARLVGRQVKVAGAVRPARRPIGRACRPGERWRSRRRRGPGGSSLSAPGWESRRCDDVSSVGGSRDRAGSCSRGLLGGPPAARPMIFELEPFPFGPAAPRASLHEHEPSVRSDRRPFLLHPCVESTVIGAVTLSVGGGLDAVRASYASPRRAPGGVLPWQAVRWRPRRGRAPPPARPTSASRRSWYVVRRHDAFASYAAAATTAASSDRRRRRAMTRPDTSAPRRCAGEPDGGARRPHPCRRDPLAVDLPGADHAPPPPGEPLPTLTQPSPPRANT